VRDGNNWEITRRVKTGGPLEGVPYDCDGSFLAGLFQSESVC
jgi:hypothetical protein